MLIDQLSYFLSFCCTYVSIRAACLVVNCGSGDCKKGDGLSYTCECHPGSSNLLNLNMLPCMKNCMCDRFPNFNFVHQLIDLFVRRPTVFLYC